ncbi:MAG: AraC family transcriptional regulator [Chloroflexi bacterium]|nr:AraC family transcriptional regulator [Chloroflexota bacterium]
MYQGFAPALALQAAIESYWRLRAPLYRIAQQMIVDGFADLIFSFGVGYERRSAGDSQTLAYSNLDAQREHAIAIIQQGDIHLVGVRFRPGGLAAFLPIPAQQLANQTLDLHSVFGTAASVLEQQLYDSAHDAAAQVRLLDAFFLRRLRTSTAYAFAHTIAREIDRQQGEITMRALSAEIGYSVRTIDRLFGQYFGLTPKFYARSVRFRRALRLLAQSPTLNLTAVAVACGYYDLAHFSKECSALAGMNAEACRAFVRARTQAPPPLVEFLTK